MATTEIAYTVDGTTVVSKAFAYGTIATFDDTTINDSDVLDIYHNGNLLTLTTHYTIDEVTEVVTLVGSYSLTVGDTMVIRRDTDIEAPIVVHSNNTIVDGNDANLAILQLLYALQELKTDSDNSLKYDLVNDCWDAEGYKICNLGSGESSTDAVNLGQVQNMIAGVDTGEVDNITRWSFTGDGSTTAYTLTDPPSGLVAGDQVIVTVDGVVQLPTTNYTLAKGATTVLTFTTAPASTTVIQIWTVEGIVSVSFPDGSITGDALEDDAIGVDKLNVGVGDADRFLVFDINGDPTAQTITHSYISDFDSRVQSNRLDHFNAPNTSLSMGNNQITNLTAGTLSTDAVNKGQMDNAITAAIPTGDTDIGGVVQSGLSSSNLSTPVTISNAGSTAMMVYAEVGTGGAASSVSMEIKTASGSYIECGNVEFTAASSETSTITGCIPAGGSCRISGTAGSDLVQLNTQAFS